MKGVECRLGFPTWVYPHIFQTQNLGLMVPKMRGFGFDKWKSYCVCVKTVNNLYINAFCCTFHSFWFVCSCHTAYTTELCRSISQFPVYTASKEHDNIICCRMQIPVSTMTHQSLMFLAALGYTGQGQRGDTVITETWSLKPRFCSFKTRKTTRVWKPKYWW